VLEVCVTEMPVMFALKVKSSPATVLMVEQSIVEVVAVTVKLLVFVAPVAELAARVNAGVVASTAIEPETFKIEVAGSPEVVEPYSTTYPEA
jgi:hypothetical protein